MEKCKWFERVLAPLVVIRRERSYIFWLIFVLVFGLINLWAGLLMGQFDMIDESMKEGLVFTFSISICAPFCSDIFIELLVDKRKKETSMFVTYKIVTGLLNVFWIFILCFLWTGTLRASVKIQIVIGVISLFFSFYMYCIGKMERHKEITEKYDDSEYLGNEKNRVYELENKASSTDKVIGKKGDIKL